MAPSRALYVLLIATALALAVVWQNTLQRQAGYRLQELDSEIAEQEAQQAVQKTHVSKLRNPQRIRQLASEYGLELRQPPVEAQVPPDAAPDTTVQTNASAPGGDTEPLP